MRKRGFEVLSSYRERGVSLPGRGTRHSAGYDLEAAEDVLVPARGRAVVPTGLKAYMGEDEFLGVFIRSGISIKKGLSLQNNVGIIDADYYDNPENEGHILVCVRNDSDDPFEIKKGQKVAQGIFMSYLLADADRASGDRNGGLGSTGG